MTSPAHLEPFHLAERRVSRLRRFDSSIPRSWNTQTTAMHNARRGGAWRGGLLPRSDRDPRRTAAGTGIRMDGQLPKQFLSFFPRQTLALLSLATIAAALGSAPGGSRPASSGRLGRAKQGRQSARATESGKSKFKRSRLATMAIPEVEQSIKAAANGRARHRPPSSVRPCERAILQYVHRYRRGRRTAAQVAVKRRLVTRARHSKGRGWGGAVTTVVTFAIATHP